MKHNTIQRTIVGVLSACTLANGLAQGLTNFGTINLTPAFELDGAGANMDSIAFWEAPDPSETLMFVTGKDNDLLEVWKYPFQGNELPARPFSANVNGVAVDQETDLLYVSDRVVSVLSLPDLELQREFGQGIIGVGENNLAILKHTDGRTLIYVSEDHSVHRFDAATLNHLGSFAPPVTSIETVLADDFQQIIFVPEEQGIEGNPGVYAYHPDGTPFERNGTNRFGAEAVFDSDEEGILLYTFPSIGIRDDGTGFIVVTDQRSDQSDFEFFDRVTWSHLGTLRLTGVSNTDGIASTQRALPDYPMGLFVAINDDSATVGLGWDVILEATGWDLAPEATRIIPATAGPTSSDEVDFEVLFSEPVTNFNDAADLLITHQGTDHTGVTITGVGATYRVRVFGISGVGSFTLAVSTNSSVQDLTANALTASVTSVPVVIRTAYQVWVSERGLVPGVNDDFADDPDHDGCPNIEEFATDSDPLSGVSDGKWRVTVEEIDAASHFTYTFPVRERAVFSGTGRLSATVDGIVYFLAGSPDLTDFDATVVELTPAVGTGLALLSEGWAYRSFRGAASVAESSAGFMLRWITPAP